MVPNMKKIRPAIIEECAKMNIQTARWIAIDGLLNWTPFNIPRFHSGKAGNTNLRSKNNANILCQNCISYKSESVHCYMNSVTIKVLCMEKHRCLQEISKVILHPLLEPFNVIDINPSLF